MSIEQRNVGDSITAVVEDTTPQLGGDLDGQGHYLVDVQNILDLASKGQEYYFDGVDNYINLDLAVTELVDTANTKGAILWAGIINSFDTDFSRLWGFGDANAIEHIAVYSKTNYKFWGICRSLAATQWNFETDNTFEEDVKYVVILVHDGIEPKLYVNGKLEPITFVTSTDKTKWFADTTGIDTGRLGCLNYGSLGNIYFLNSTCNRFLAETIDLSETEVKALSSGAPIPFKYLGASQTELHVGPNAASDPAGNEADATTGWTNGYGVPTFISVGTENGVVPSIGSHQIHIEATLNGYREDYAFSTTVGKHYKVIIKAYKYQGSQPFLFYVASSNIGDNLSTKISSSTLLTASLYTEYEQVCVATTETSYISLRLAGASATANITYIDNISITQIGCVLQLEQPGISHGQWLDTSGNEAHGEVDGAAPVNLESNHTEKYQHSTAITDDTTFTSIIPTGYELEKIIFIESAGNAATIDLGTVATGNDIFINQVITASSITTVVINKTFSMSAAQSLFLNDDDAGSSWNSASITATLLMRRIV